MLGFDLRCRQSKLIFFISNYVELVTNGQA
jgi:hypothetical protein